MGFFSKNKTEERGLTNSSNPVLGTLKFSVFGNSSAAAAMKQGIVYSIVNQISNTIASLPLLPYDIIGDWSYLDDKTNLYYLFNVEPNPFMSAFTFKKTIISQMLLKGNSYIIINRDTRTGEATQLTLLYSDAILTEFVDGNIQYRDTLSGEIYDRSQIIHIMNYGSTFYRGESTISYMFNSINIGNALDNYQRSFTQSGMMVNGILKPVDGNKINGKQADAAKESFNSSINNLSTNSVIVLDSGFDFQQISISPKDAKFLESSKLNNETICRFFNINPAMVGVNITNWTTSEQLQLEYLSNCIAPIISKIEQEFFRKIYFKPDWNTKKLKFDTSELLRVDSVAQSNYFKSLVEIGALSVNEVRSKINANYPTPNGNKHWISTNLQQLDNPIVNINNSVDNKLLIDKNNTNK